jgi:AraC-like DNA-binding protein
VPITISVKPEKATSSKLGSAPLDAWEALADRARFSPAALAALCHVSERTVQRHFRAHYNLTVKGWLNDLRLQRAYKRLLAGDRIKLVAFDLGFKQLSHFSRAFKEKFGCPPRHLSSCLWSRGILALHGPNALGSSVSPLRPRDMVLN